MHRAAFNNVSTLHHRTGDCLRLNAYALRQVDSNRARPCALLIHCITNPVCGSTNQHQPCRLRIQLARRREHFHAVACIWAEALLLQGLTDVPPPATEEELRRSEEQIADRLRQSYERKLQAAADSRSLRLQGEAILHQLQHGTLTGLEYQMARRQLEAVRRDLRRTRRRRLWACLVAWEDPVPAGGSPHVSAPRFGSDAELMAQRRTDMTQQQLQERVQHEEDVEGGKEEEYSTHGLEPAPSPQWPHVRVCQGQQAAPQRGGGGRQDVCRGGGDSGRSRGGSGADRCSGGESGTASGHGSGDKSGTASGHGSGGESGGRLNQDSRLDRGGVDDEPKAVGYVLVSVSQPLAMLPPPLPSTSPQQFHVDALAVGARFRRQGVGSRLLAAVEQLVMRWGGKSLWLHVDACNDAAVQMYSDRDYGIVRIQRPRLVVPSSLLGRPTIGCRPPFPPFLPHSCLGRLMGASIVSVLQPQSQGHQGGGQGPQLEKQQGQRTHQESPPNSVLFLEQQQLRNPPYSLRNQEQLQQLQVSLAQWRQRQRSRKFVMQKRLQQ